MYRWNVYHENADTDEKARYIGTIEASNIDDALKQASQYYEYPDHDLVVKLYTQKASLNVMNTPDNFESDDAYRKWEEENDLG